MEQAIFIVGVPSETTWSTCTHFHSASSELYVSLTANHEHDAARMGRELLHAVQTWNEQAHTFSDALSFFSQYVLPAGIHAVIWYTQREQCLFYVSGGSAGMQRQGTYFPIVAYTDTPVCVQGSVQPPDILFFGTKAFSDTVAPILMQANDPLGTSGKLAADHKILENANMCGQIVSLDESEPTSDIHEPLSKVVSLDVTQPHTPQVTKPSSTSTNRIWIHTSARTKKILAFGIFVGIALLGVFMLQRFVLLTRSRRIDSVIVPLQTRLQEVTTSSQPRLEKEKQLAQLVEDSKQAQENNPTDPAVLSKLSTLSTQIEQQYLITAKQKSIDHLSIFYDFRLITADFIGSQIQYDAPGKLAVFLDTNRGKIVSLSLEKKQPQTLSINEDIGAIQSLSIIDRKAYLLGTKGLYEVSLPLDTPGEIVASASAGWQNPKLLGSFAKNLYVFDPQARQIFRYDRDDFSASPSSWLRGKEGVELDSIDSLAIDGEIYAGTTKGIIYKFSRGDRAQFSYHDLLNPPTTAVTLYTSELTQNLYVLEPRQKRIIVLDKTGTYVSSIVCPDLESATALIVDEDGKKIYVLSGSLVYEIDL